MTDMTVTETGVFEVTAAWDQDIDIFQEYDQQLEAVVGRSSMFSGYGCGQRDLGWEFDTEAEMIAAAKKLTAALDELGLEGSVEMTPPEAATT